MEHRLCECTLLFCLFALLRLAFNQAVTCAWQKDTGSCSSGKLNHFELPCDVQVLGRQIYTQNGKHYCYSSNFSSACTFLSYACTVDLYFPNSWGSSLRLRRIDPYRLKFNSTNRIVSACLKNQFLLPHIVLLTFQCNNQKPTSHLLSETMQIVSGCFVRFS